MKKSPEKTLLMNIFAVVIIYTIHLTITNAVTDVSVSEG